MASTRGSGSFDHNAVYHKRDDDKYQEFFATLRPYKADELHTLLKTIRDKDSANLGRTKLHQIREAVLKMNLTTSVSDGLSVLHNWREKQRNYVAQMIYEFAGKRQMQYGNSDPNVWARLLSPSVSDGVGARLLSPSLVPNKSVEAQS